MSRPLDPATRKSALARLVEVHQGPLYRYLRYLGCSRALAEDLMQETFLAVWRKPFEVRSEAATAAYLRRVAHNRFISEVRRRRARPALVDLEQAAAVWDRYHAADEGFEYREALRECLGILTGKVRTVLALFYGRDESRERIAETMAMRVDGVKTMLRRAREALHACIERKVTA